jgi:NAD(P)-dependent dehydrogenase (short-subunit alcohol dehydrogenase family)
VRLAGQVAIVTGGGRGIGRAIAEAFGREGAHVVVAARGVAEIEVVADALSQQGVRSLAVPTDVADEASVARLVQTTLAQFDRLDVLVNNAALGQPRCRVQDLSVSLWDEIMAVNVRGPFLCARAALPTMVRLGRGRIINIASIGGRRGRQERSAYRASKAALLSLTESLADEVKALGVNVNAICPGGVATRLLRESFPDRDPATLMEPDDVAAVAVFLASDDARALHGAALDVFGAASGIQAGA